MAYQWTRQEKFKRGVWSVAVAAVICVGAITGAQLKTDKQKGEVTLCSEMTFLGARVANDENLGNQAVSGDVDGGSDCYPGDPKGSFGTAEDGAGAEVGCL